MTQAYHHHLGDPELSGFHHGIRHSVLCRWHLDSALNHGKEIQSMKKNIIFLIGGIVTGFALCLTTAMLIPLDNELDAFEGRIGPRGL